MYKCVYFIVSSCIVFLLLTVSLTSNASGNKCYLKNGTNYISFKADTDKKGILSLKNLINAPADSVKKKIAALKKLKSAQADSIKKKVAALKKPKIVPPDTIKIADTKKSVSLLKKLADALKFTQNSRNKEKQRIIAIIDSLVLGNGALATAQNVDDLKKQLTDTTRQQYAELLFLIKDLQKKQIEQANATANTPVPQNEVNVNDLIAKILPMLKSVTNDHSLNIDRQKRIQKIRALFGRPADQVDTLKINDTSSLVYKIKLTHKAQVIGYDLCSLNNNNYLNYNYKALTGIALHCYMLNSSDGYCRDISSGKTEIVVQKAKANNINVYLSVYTNTHDITSFLNNTVAQNNFNRSIIKLLGEQGAKGVNLNFGQISVNSRLKFSLFIKNLSKALNSSGTPVELNITLPVNSSNATYDLKELNSYVTYFIIDFSRANTTKGGPLAPLKGNGNNLQLTFSRYLNSGVLLSKFLVCLPYEGIKWSYTKGGSKGTNPQYLSYTTIRSDYPNSFYNLDSSIVYATNVKPNGDIDTVWYDDENTLAKKYDYILQNKLGGIAIWKLGDDDGYGELWDAITDKFISIDTIKVSHLNYAIHPVNLTLLQKFKVYYYLFQKPCEEFFPNDILKILNIQPDDKKGNYNAYNLVTAQVQHFLLIANILLGVLCVISIVTLIYFIKIEGEWWPYRKPLTGFIIVIVLLLGLTLVADLYLDDNIPWFGANNNGNCIDMPFHVLMSIVTIAIIAGVLLMRFLILPFMKREDIP